MCRAQQWLENSERILERVRSEEKFLKTVRDKQQALKTPQSATPAKAAAPQSSANANPSPTKQLQSQQPAQQPKQQLPQTAQTTSPQQHQKSQVPPPQQPQKQQQQQQQGAKIIKWMPDDSVSACCICQTEFSLFNRRHHCRLCGIVVCDACSPKQTRKEFGGAAERVCKKHGKENEQA